MLIFFVVFCMLLTSAFALDATVTYPGKHFDGAISVAKSAPSMVGVSDEFTIIIEITNGGNSTVEMEVTEFLPNVEPVDPLPNYTEVEDESDLIVQAPRLSWLVELAPGQSRTLLYRVKALTVGTIAFGPTEVLVPGGKFYSNGLLVDVECSPSPSCDESIGETPTNCPDKCGGNANATAPQAPPLQKIDTPAYAGPVETAPEADYSLLIAAVVIAALVAMLIIFSMKKQPF